MFCKIRRKGKLWFADEDTVSRIEKSRRSHEEEELKEGETLTFLLCELVQQTRLPDSHITCRERG